jgi:hypothetical protein
MEMLNQLKRTEAVLPRPAREIMVAFLCAAVLLSEIKLGRRRKGTSGSTMTPAELPPVRFSERKRERLLI